MSETLTPQVGDFVQLKTWFGDVWAEVTKSYGDWFFYAKYPKNDPNRERDHNTFTEYVRAVRKRDELNFNRDIIYATDGYWRYGERICGE